MHAAAGDRVFCNKKIVTARVLPPPALREGVGQGGPTGTRLYPLPNVRIRPAPQRGKVTTAATASFLSNFTPRETPARSRRTAAVPVRTSDAWCRELSR